MLNFLTQWRWSSSALLAVALLPSLLLGLPPDSAQAAPREAFTLTLVRSQALTPVELAAAQKTETLAVVSGEHKILPFRQKTIRLVAVTGPDADMLSYRIAGLRNPSLIVPRGAIISLLFVNTDDDMTHNIRFGPLQSAYPNVMTPYLRASEGTSELPHKTETALYGEELTLHVPSRPGTYAYLCTVRGHAQGGMNGKIIVK